MSSIKINSLFTTILLLFTYAVQAQLNGSLLISGRVVDDQQKPLNGISVLIKGVKGGTITDSTGNFKLVVNKQIPFTIVFSGVGFSEKEVPVTKENEQLQIQLFTQSYYANEVVVSATRSSERIMQSPVTIEKLDIRALKETPSASFYDALGN